MAGRLDALFGGPLERASRARRLRGLSLATLLIAVPALALAEAVDITADTTTGINLDAQPPGSTVRVFPNVSVSNAGTLMPNGTFSAFHATQPWTLTNEGTIDAALGNAITFNGGGAVINQSTITSGFNGVWFGAAGSVENAAGAEIHGGTSAVICAFFLGGCSEAVNVVNYGTITSDSADTVTLQGGGTVTNHAGGLIQAEGSNAVSIIFGTTREVVNSGTIRTNAPTAAAISINPGTVTNNAGGEIIGTFNGVWAHSGGAMTVVNHGLIEATAANFNFGIPGSAVELDAGGSITNTGIIRSSSTNNTDAAIYASGATTITNSGTIQSLTGGLAIQFDSNAANTLNLNTGSVLGGNVQGGSGTDNLVLMGTGTENIGRFLSFETLSMQGTNWTLDGTGTFSTSATVAAGRLDLDGVLTSPTLIVDAGALLGGTGSLLGNTLNSGTISPGNSIGTLTVSGDVTFSAGSFFDVEVSGTPALLSDFLDVGGAAHLDGNGTVRVFPEPGSYPPSYTYHILTAAGGVNGCFGDVVSTSAFFTPDLDCQPNDVFLTLTQNGTAFVDVAETPNQVATAEALQERGPAIRCSTPSWRSAPTRPAPPSTSSRARSTRRSAMRCAPTAAIRARRRSTASKQPSPRSPRENAMPMRGTSGPAASAASSRRPATATPRPCGRGPPGSSSAPTGC